MYFLTTVTWFRADLGMVFILILSASCRDNINLAYNRSIAEAP